MESPDRKGYSTEGRKHRMKIGKDLVTWHESYITSWKSDDDPSKGDYTFGCDLRGYPHQVIKKGQNVTYRSEPWNGIDFGGISFLPQNAIYKFDMVFNQTQVFYSYRMINSSMLSRLTMNRSGVAQRWVWADQVNDWIVYFSKPTPDGCDLVYIRVAFSELGVSGSRKKKRKVIPLVIALVGVVFMSVGLMLFVWRKWMKNSVAKGEDEQAHKDTDQLYTNESQKDDLELPLFNLSEIAKATHNFLFNNKLGEGGYGPVYKGILPDGKEVAVKRLSKTSNQGLDEFKNEVICISKLQHRNLVKLLGCCIQGDEKMLIYEYMPKKSLDYFIFDESRRKLLDWPERFNIVNGIARGLQYLHQDSRLRIIHRDLKASNILLDFDMNPKISDFGMARSFIGNETQANTMKVVGTYGYMSPEYAMDGIFSVKSDVFSFGVLVLEIVTGKKNRGFFHHDHHHNLLGHAWHVANDDMSSTTHAPSLTTAMTITLVHGR
ncbi:hypothetical protein L2E82_46229 [Cichorium intybus]|uniref:Uncharacterized protein n=1 Tax=Cichorium intybus TaxID=13427 RepID=A0ACB8YTG9_CICIN|nr:hypothetical protein L2E82_46229 [Cichorium intybus]